MEELKSLLKAYISSVSDIEAQIETFEQQGIFDGLEDLRALLDEMIDNKKKVQDQIKKIKRIKKKEEQKSKGQQRN